MLIGPNGSPPVLVSVTDFELEDPALTSPKSIDVVSIAMSVSTATTVRGTITPVARPITKTAAPTPYPRIRPILTQFG
ncbi:hypothetical protein BH18ACT3_BH18ACT3_04830 [soil metagenome]